MTGTRKRTRAIGARRTPRNACAGPVLFLLCVSFLLGSRVPLLACPICFPYPKKSVADHLLAADTVVFARENPNRPYHLRAVEVLKGTVEGDAPDQFLDTTTRRRLALHPDWGVVVVRVREGDTLQWRRIALADGAFAPIVREILLRADDWTHDGTTDARAAAERRRFEYFAGVLGSPARSNAQVRALAHHEVARAPYRDIRALPMPIPREELRASLDNVRLIEWSPLFILLLARSDHPEDQKLIRDSFASRAEWGSTTNLAAWATAAIEIDGAPAVAMIGERYLGRPGRTDPELVAVLQALSIQGTEGRVELRDAIASAYTTLLEKYPDHAARIAPDLIAWERWEFLPAYTALLGGRGPRDPWSAAMIRRYISSARSFGPTAHPREPDERP